MDFTFSNLSELKKILIVFAWNILSLNFHFLGEGRQPSEAHEKRIEHNQFKISVSSKKFTSIGVSVD